jgi:predicted enzyme related to lactoylglutathione lyase
MRNLLLRTALAVTVLLGLGACSKPIVPPVTSPPTGTQQVGKFVWFDLLTEELAETEKFYSDLFGWSFQKLEGRNDYWLIRHEDELIGGVFYTARLGARPKARWLSYLSVSDVDRATQLAVDQGGAVHIEPVDFPNRGRFAIVSDPQGAVIALLRSTAGDPTDQELEVGEWMWNELWTTNTKTAFDFYQELVGYEKEVFGAVEGQDYWLMRRGDRRRAGMVKLPWQRVEPGWLPYVLVDDVKEIVEKTNRLGGRVLLAPEGVHHNGSAVISDPGGAAIAVQTLPPERRGGGDNN